MNSKTTINTKFSYVIMGYGNFTRGQMIKGLLFLTLQISYIIFISTFGIKYLSQLISLGDVARVEIFDPELGIYVYDYIDNSMLILLYSVLSLFVTGLFIYLYIINIKSSRSIDTLISQNKKVKPFKEEIKEYLNKKFHITLLAFPIMTIVLFTVIPLIFMILIAFTNYDKNHQPPGLLFDWIGFQNFKDVFSLGSNISNTFFSILLWTIVWAILATVTNYILGMVLAMVINKKSIKFKKLWRNIFIITIAVPQFISLMIMSKMLDLDGVYNTILLELGLIKEKIGWLTTASSARIMVLIVNIWVGIPYTILITTGILMNIPKEMYEAAMIDGASPTQRFWYITMPYMLFVTGPYLITAFIGNINNFNVIYLLTGGGPLTLDYFKAGKTDLLITWLYKLTASESNFKLASVIGILVFIITATFSLLVYNKTSSVKNEEVFR